MSDLIDKYFSEDLTQAEDEALEGLLSTSEVAAERFFAKAEKDYFSYGLPDPVSTGIRSWIRPIRGWMGPAVLLMVLLMGGLFWSTHSVPLSREAAPVVVPSSPQVPVTEQRSIEKKVVPLVRKIAPKTETTSVRETGSEPPAIGGISSKTYAGVRVIVKQENAGPVVVRVLDSDGAEVRRLYDGPLSAGQWAFTWDGVRKDKTAASPGDYAIEINNGRTVLTQEVEIRKGVPEPAGQ